MRRRIALAAALVHDSDLLFVDEPTANLDPILRARLWAHFHGLRERGRTLLATTQYIDEAEHSDRVGLMHDGTLIAAGRPAALRRRAFGADIVDIVVERSPPGYAAAVRRLAGVRELADRSDEPLRVIVEDAESAIPDLIGALEASGVAVRSVAPFHPTFDEVFIRLIVRHNARRPDGERPAGGADAAAER